MFAPLRCTKCFGVHLPPTFRPLVDRRILDARLFMETGDFALLQKMTGASTVVGSNDDAEGESENAVPSLSPSATGVIGNFYFNIYLRWRGQTILPRFIRRSVDHRKINHVSNLVPSTEGLNDVVLFAVMGVSPRLVYTLGENIYPRNLACLRCRSVPSDYA